MIHSNLTAAAIDEWHIESELEHHARAWHLPEDGIEEATRGMVLALAELTHAMMRSEKSSFMDLVLVHRLVSDYHNLTTRGNLGRFNPDMVAASVGALAEHLAEFIDSKAEARKQ